MRYNAARLADPRIAERVLNLLDAVGRTGFHATMRELLGFVAYLITGDIEDTDEASAPYFMNAFVGGQGALFDLIREFDPLRSPHAFLDDILFMCEDKGEDWLVEADWEACRAEDLASFERRKRRAYFEHSLGQRLIRYGGDEIERTFQKLRTSTPPPERLAARILNRFFNSRDDLNTETLTLWVGHQFHARPTRFVAAYQGVPASDLEIAVPVLPSDLSSVFPHHYPDHVVLRHKKMNAHDGLVIDRRLLQMLLAADRVAGLGTRTLEGQRRVGAFYDRLARFADVERSQPVIQILRLDTSTVIRIGVDVPNRQYFVPGI
jgi:hypothetical protein